MLYRRRQTECSFKRIHLDLGTQHQNDKLYNTNAYIISENICSRVREREIEGHNGITIFKRCNAFTSLYISFPHWWLYVCVRSFLCKFLPRTDVCVCVFRCCCYNCCCYCCCHIFHTHTNTAAHTKTVFLFLSSYSELLICIRKMIWLFTTNLFLKWV